MAEEYDIELIYKTKTKNCFKNINTQKCILKERYIIIVYFIAFAVLLHDDDFVNQIQ